MTIMGRLSVMGVMGLAFLLGAAFELQATSSDAPTDADCLEAWDDSGATNSCGTQYFQAGASYVDTSDQHVVAQNGQCYVEVYCRWANTPISPEHNTFLGTEEQVESLNNCNSELQEGDC